jgi:hypothetical protein
VHYYQDLLKTLYTEHFAEHIFNTNHTYNNIVTNLEIAHTLTKAPKLNIIVQCEIYKHYK